MFDQGEKSAQQSAIMSYRWQFFQIHASEYINEIMVAAWYIYDAILDNEVYFNLMDLFLSMHLLLLGHPFTHRSFADHISLARNTMDRFLSNFEQNFTHDPQHSSTRITHRHHADDSKIGALYISCPVSTLKTSWAICAEMFMEQLTLPAILSAATNKSFFLPVTLKKLLME